MLLSQVAEHAAERWGIPPQLARARLEQSLRRKDFIATDAEDRAIDTWDGAVIDWENNSADFPIDLRVRPHNVGRPFRLSSIRIDADHLDKWLDADIADRKIAHARSEENRRHARDYAFEEPFWPRRRVFSWIAYRSREHILRSYTTGLLNSTGPQRYGDPPAELMRALQKGEITAIKGGEKLPSEFWAGRDIRRNRWPDGLHFRPDDVLRIWPPIADAAEVSPSNVGRPRKRGPQTAKTESLAAKLSAQLKAGTLLPAKLECEKEETMATALGVSRWTYRKARDKALSEFRGVQNSDK